MDLRPEEKVRSVPETYRSLPGQISVCSWQPKEESEARECRPLCAHLISHLSMRKAVAMWGPSDAVFTHLPGGYGDSSSACGLRDTLMNGRHCRLPSQGQPGWSVLSGQGSVPGLGEGEMTGLERWRTQDNVHVGGPCDGSGALGIRRDGICRDFALTGWALPWFSGRRPFRRT